MFDLIDLIFANKFRHTIGAFTIVFSVILAPVLYFAHPGPVAAGGVALFILAIIAGVFALRVSGWRGALSSIGAIVFFVLAAIVMRQQR